MIASSLNKMGNLIDLQLYAEYHLKNIEINKLKYRNNDFDRITVE